MRLRSNNPLAVRLGPLVLKNPVIMASGIFGYGDEMRHFLDYRCLGAIVTKTVTLQPWKGNPQPRLWETSAGMINAIGLQNVGLERFLEEKLPRLRRLGTIMIVSISGNTTREFCVLAETLARQDVQALELNISCPNLRFKKKMVATCPRLVLNLVKDVRRVFPRKCLLVKLSPNVTDITSIALAAEEGGADGLTLINTVKALAVDLEGRRLITGGLSGPAIKPVGLRCVYEVYRRVKLPLIGLGGILSGADALDYILVGASAVGIGSGFFSNPLLPQEVTRYLLGKVRQFQCRTLSEMVGIFNEKETGV
ncbi:MAG TPA: dihydroorotate dehydrogenase [bacterium]|nr:dihydroorotate dehydrogenase [bacterium]HPP12228.1 dihydroorotate dehydrogenase [bacterium]